MAPSNSSAPTPDEMLGTWVRAQVLGWKESRQGHMDAPLLEGVPLHIYGSLRRRETPFGPAYRVGGYDVEPSSIRQVPEGESFPRDRYVPQDERHDDQYPWRRRLRRLQSLYRERVLAVAPGTHKPPNGPERAVDSHLPTDVVAIEPSLNFLLDSDVEARARARLARKGWGGIVKRDRLYHDLLSSQPLCFNLFGFLDLERDALLRVLREVFEVDAKEAGEVRTEWAPPRTPTHRSGSAFDCLIEYTTSANERGFVAAECKYSEDLRDQTPTSPEENPEYQQITESNDDVFLPGAAEALNERVTCQLWYNLCLALHLAKDGYAEYQVFMLSCRDDSLAKESVDRTRAQMRDPDRLLRWLPYESIIEAIQTIDELQPWATHFAGRYLPGVGAEGEQFPLGYRMSLEPRRPQSRGTRSDRREMPRS